jgi:DNA-binding PadR family transcriptional regulator
MSRRSHADGELGRPNEPAVLILTSLASGPKHGYGLAQDIGQFAGVTLGPGTLYGAITRLEEGGFIEPAGEEERRRPYRITTSGRAALAKAVAEMRAIADEGAARLSLRSAGPAATGPGGGLLPGWTS